MNAFSIPAMAGMIYAMPSMETQLHAVINKPGVYQGLSANYSGNGFSDMHFKFHGMSQADFNQWVQQAKGSDKGELSRAAFTELAKPSHAVPVTRFASVDPQLYHAILNRCVDTAKMCMDQMMSIDARGGLGRAGTINVATKPAEDGQGKPQRYVAAFCTVADARGTAFAQNRPEQTSALN
jgi:cytochrome o ubiquinol oxidase subunit II